MIALSLVRLIEKHSVELSQGLMKEFEDSRRTSDLQKVPREELQNRCEEIFRHLGDWLLTKSSSDIEHRYFAIGQTRAAQGVSMSDFSWSIMLTKGHLWEFLQRQGFLRGPVEIYGEMELLRLLDNFFDRALCFAVEGYEQYAGVRGTGYEAHQVQASL